MKNGMSHTTRLSTQLLAESLIKLLDGAYLDLIYIYIYYESFHIPTKTTKTTKTRKYTN